MYIYVCIIYIYYINNESKFIQTVSFLFIYLFIYCNILHYVGTRHQK